MNEQVKTKKRFGKMQDMVRLNVWVVAQQDKELDRICQLTGKTKQTCVADALASYIGHFVGVK